MLLKRGERTGEPGRRQGQVVGGRFWGNKVIESIGSCFLPSPLATYTCTFRRKDKQSSGYLIHGCGGVVITLSSIISKHDF